MKISHIEHLGIGVQSIEEALPYFENVLGLRFLIRNLVRISQKFIRRHSIIAC